ncbi:probable G-protein coupled receptor No18 [Uloborus diversus]|uniref:probable G-protein coupled receptor No18 n=1 Tax=Uloborus diversus TaxID=327109 RepID=UPI00240A2FFB|nr:probable G-protein coupled receptor No18 [Uloborus diversus]
MSCRAPKRYLFVKRFFSLHSVSEKKLRRLQGLLRGEDTPKELRKNAIHRIRFSFFATSGSNHKMEENERSDFDIYGNKSLLNFTEFLNKSFALLDISDRNDSQNDFSGKASGLTMPLLQAILTAIVLGVIMFGTMVGNILVVLSVFTYKPLRNVQNIFLVSLAAADIAVAVFVMPFNVAYNIMGKWVFGLHLCKAWLTCDVLCCTASILNLVAIALDRYWAIHDPINYAQKRTLNRVLFMILGVWSMSLVISVPPLIGWNDWPETFTTQTPCQLTEERGYVVYSASGSFFSPLIIMTVVYIKIFQTARNRIRVKAKAAANIMKKDADVNVTSAKSLNIPVKTVSSDVSSRETKTDNSSVNCNSSSIEMEDKSSTPQNSISKENQDNNATATVDETKEETEVEKPVAAVVTVRSYMEQKERICLQKERRAAQVLGIVMGVFVLCWLPFFLMYIILPFCDSCYISGDIMNFITWLGYLNSALNPVIYTVFNTDFRRSFHNLLFGKHRS